MKGPFKIVLTAIVVFATIPVPMPFDDSSAAYAQKRGGSRGGGQAAARSGGARAGGNAQVRSGSRQSINSSSSNRNVNRNSNRNVNRSGNVNVNGGYHGGGGCYGCDWDDGPNVGGALLVGAVTGAVVAAAVDDD